MNLRILIVGAGPAGSVAALLLARSGISATLIEQHRFPRDKVCGECVSALGWDVLERVGLATRVQDAGAVEMRRGVVHAPNGRAAELELPGSMWGISRGVFDSILLEAAREVGVEILQPARLEEHGQDASVTWVSVRDLKSNQVRKVECDLILMADGKGLRPQASGDFGIKAHFDLSGVPRDAVQLFGAKACYIGVAPIEAGLFNIACSVPRERIERARDVETVFLEMVRDNRGLAELMRTGKRISPWLASPLPRFGVAKEWPAGVIPLGNAAAALEPIGGEGMGLAMRSAELAAEAIAQCPNVSLLQKKLQAEFRRLWNRRRFIWRTVAMFISKPSLCELAVEAMTMTTIAEQMVRWGKDSNHWSNEAPAVQ